MHVTPYGRITLGARREKPEREGSSEPGEKSAFRVARKIHTSVVLAVEVGHEVDTNTK